MAQADFRSLLGKRIIIFDGAMGTSIQALEIPDAAWEGKAGCNEILNKTAPEYIDAIHDSFLAAGADVVETNSFGATSIVLDDYDLASQSADLNRRAAEIARKAAGRHTSADRPRFVAGSMGPGTKLPTLGHITFDELYTAFRKQADALLEGGADLLVVETSQDLLQTKAAVIAAGDSAAQSGRDIPIIASVTVEQSGTMLMGSDLSAVVATLHPLRTDLIGINCAVGPDLMGPNLEQLASIYNGPIFCMPNAGLPEMKDGKTVYSLGPVQFAEIMAGYLARFHIAVAGGCCGTTPEYIRQLALRAEKMRPVPAPTSPMRPVLSSLFSAQPMIQEPAPFLIAEQANSNGSKVFRGMIDQEDWDAAADFLLDQTGYGAHAADLCVAVPGRNERSDMLNILNGAAARNRLPFVIDSTDPQVIETALKAIGGRPLINSINLEAGEEHAQKVFALAARYGAAIICLTIDEEGMAKTVEKKVAIARRLAAIARHAGLRNEDLVFDPLTFTLGSGDESLRSAGTESIRALSAIKEAVPGCLTVMGVSNISFGLAAPARRVLNSLFLSEAVSAGLDMAIVNPKKIRPVAALDPEARKAALDLIYHNEDGSALLRYLELFEKGKGISEEENKEKEQSLPPQELLRSRVIAGSKDRLEEIINRCLETTAAGDIINEILIPAMGIVGERFGKGEMQLPFVLQSAEVMKRSVSILEPHMEKGDSVSKRGTVILATVAGDVHDIGKNLVDIILSNNGYLVKNLGIKIGIDTIIKAAEEEKATAVGMSGLLVKSTAIMKSNLEEMKRRKLRLPVLLGGAALTPAFVEGQCRPAAPAEVYYCKDAFDALKALDSLKKAKGSAGSGQEADRGVVPAAPITPASNTPAPASTDTRKNTRPAPSPAQTARSAHGSHAPQAAEVCTCTECRPAGSPGPLPPPFFGARYGEGFDLHEIFETIDRRTLFRGRWGYKRGKMEQSAYEALIETEVLPKFEALKKLIIEEGLFVPHVRYGFFRCSREGDRLTVEQTGKKPCYLPFARLPQEKGGCLADRFPEEGGILPLQIVTLGEGPAQKSHLIYSEDRYGDYLRFHGLAAEATDALAALVHKSIDTLLFPSGTRTKRYSFGYPCCPDLEANRTIGALLDAASIGIGFTESGQMLPELSTSAVIVPYGL
ncbi:methionine synthase [Sediminispirochaeta smaragdinae]|uniref:Methionine synthase n=1 Tax=Sediminispirochaeta smaragdinae (strain DSM 11293 / JCM 15392 / SEBR 4228) TaxID=573413 RepID=E1RBM2_SEDSS|nr:homocysteine S-methyltransferase family protein [Sediminispirochaeta smaragdinae]ADK79752.1 homocysteine S-methyltransferase [Sediminispirochaeta smaragdinae DSM 11293]